MATSAKSPGLNLDLRAIAIVPARLASQRLPRKMLLSDTGKPLFVHTVENVRTSGCFARVVVATDADEIAHAAEKHGVEAVTTRADHTSGTDRVCEAFRTLRARGESANVVVNVQGDEPDLAADDLARLVAVFADARMAMATLAVTIADEAELANPSVVKVVCDARGDALYFSRAPIPARGHARTREAPLARRHVGVYAFTPDALERFCALPRGKLEECESLEQLRWLEAGEKLRVLAASRAPRGIDTREDYEQFVARWKASTRGGGGAEHGTNLERAGAG